MTQRARLKKLAGLGTRFLIVGGLSTLIEIAAFNALHYGLGWGIIAAKIVASLIALINAYFGNREWTFRNRGHHGRGLELVLFIVVNAICTGLGAAIVAGGVWALGSPGPILVNAVNLASIVIIVLVRFLLYHFIVFRGVRQRVADEQTPAVS